IALSVIDHSLQQYIALSVADLQQLSINDAYRMSIAGAHGEIRVVDVSEQSSRVTGSGHRVPLVPDASAVKHEGPFISAYRQRWLHVEKAGATGSGKELS